MMTWEKLCKENKENSTCI